MSALRQRLIEDLQVRNYSPRTVEAYVAAVAKLAKHTMRSPDQLTKEDLRAFQVHLLAKKTSWSQFNQIVCGLRFFYKITLGRSDVVETLPYGKRPKSLPVVLSMEEIAQLLAAAKPGRERMLLETAYGCGLRISELLGLQVTDIAVPDFGVGWSRGALSGLRPRAGVVQLVPESALSEVSGVVARALAGA